MFGGIGNDDEELEGFSIEGWVWLEPRGLPVISQLAISLGKIATPIDNDCRAACIGWEDKDIGIVVKGAKGRTFRGAKTRFLWE